MKKDGKNDKGGGKSPKVHSGDKRKTKAKKARASDRSEKASEEYVLDFVDSGDPIHEEDHHPGHHHHPRHHHKPPPPKHRRGHRRHPPPPPHGHHPAYDDEFFSWASPGDSNGAGPETDGAINDIQAACENVISVIGSPAASAVRAGSEYAPEEIRANIMTACAISAAIQAIAKELNIPDVQVDGLAKESFVTHENVDYCQNSELPTITKNILKKLGYAPFEIKALGLLQLANVRLLDTIYSHLRKKS